MKLAIIQICSVLEPEVNLQKIETLIQQAKKAESGLSAVILPEVFYSMSDGTKATPYLVEEKNEHFENIRQLAVRNQVNLIGGSAATKVDGKVLNRSYNFNSQGELLASYDKIHLFAVDLKGKQNSTVIDEAKTYHAGDKLQTFELEGFKFGITICFDLRFPELYRKYFTQGVNVFTVSSAFTVPTGKAHWKTLVRARAIENQSYVIACDQWGEHNDKIKTYGHSLVVDPWGEVVAEVADGEGFACFELSLEKIHKIRGRIDMTPRMSWKL